MPASASPRPRRIPSAKTQFQSLIRLVLLLVLMLYSVHWASQGKHWLWITGPERQAEPRLQELELKRTGTLRPERESR